MEAVGSQRCNLIRRCHRVSSAVGHKIFRGDVLRLLRVEKGYPQHFNATDKRQLQCAVAARVWHTSRIGGGILYYQHIAQRIAIGACSRRSSVRSHSRTGRSAALVGRAERRVAARRRRAVKDDCVASRGRKSNPQRKVRVCQHCPGGQRHAHQILLKINALVLQHAGARNGRLAAVCLITPKQPTL